MQSPSEHSREITADDGPFAASLVTLRPRLQSYARSLARDADVAEDLVQDTLLRAWHAQAQFVAGTNLKAWTFTILRNLFLNARRRDRFHGEYDELAAERIIATDASQERAVELSDVESAIARLPEEQRQALRLVAISGLSTDEAARRIGAPAGTIASRVSRARAALRQVLSDPFSRPAPAPVPVVGPTRSRRGDWIQSKAAGRPLWIG